MNKYCYEITGDYKDNLKMKKEDIVIHDGNLIGLISYTNDRLEINFNYGKSVCYPCEIKKLDNIMITVPIEEYLCKSNYAYIPLVFEIEEYNEFIEISYLDEELFNYSRTVNKQDIYNVLTIQFKLAFDIIELLDFKDIVDSIVACSKENDKLTECVRNILNDEIITLKRVEKNDFSNITLFIYFLNQLYEWNSIIKVDELYYIHLIDKYAIRIN